MVAVVEVKSEPLNCYYTRKPTGYALLGIYSRVLVYTNFSEDRVLVGEHFPTSTKTPHPGKIMLF
jgi:hypothetical protein